MVAYLLRITDVDPVDLDLYFERFINPQRTSPPDFDIDFSWNERDDVIDYIVNRSPYGKDHVALLATYSTFQQDAAIRELGKEFAERNPRLAPFLAVEGQDPDVERLLEGFAFLTGRLRQKLDKGQDKPLIHTVRNAGYMIRAEP